MFSMLCMQNCTNSKNSKDKEQEKFHLIVLARVHNLL
jgi:hypothetical protein